MGGVSRRQADASSRHDGALQLSKAVLDGSRKLEQIGDAMWTITAADGKHLHTIERRHCQRICYVSLSFAFNDLLSGHLQSMRCLST